MSSLIPANKKWEASKDCFVIQNSENMSYIKMGEYLGRTTSGVRYRRHLLGLFRQSRKQKWQQWEIQYLIQNFYNEDKKVICSKLANREWEIIRAYATKQLGIKRKNKLYQYQTTDGKRKCKGCKQTLDENAGNF